jgi:glucose/arabinose dehydrogenase
LAQGLSPGFLVPSILRRTIVGGLASPTDLVFASDGTLFFTERHKGLYAQRAGAQPVPVFTPKDLASGGPSGMLAVALDPEFARNHFAYAFMRSTAAGAEGSRVARVTVDPATLRTTDRRDILLVADSPAAEASPSGEAHFGGGLRFGPDGYLYVGIGDGRGAAKASSNKSLAGTVLRIDRDGQAAPGNGAPAGTDKRVFVTGVRDPVALAFHPNSEAAVIGQRLGDRPDDVTMVRAGVNAAGAVSLVPAWRGGRVGEGLSAIERLRDPMWRDWRNAFVVAFENAQRLDLVKLDLDGRTLHATPALEKLGVGFKAVAQGPDGLYVVTSGKPGGEEIWRLSVQ